MRQSVAVGIALAMWVTGGLARRGLKFVEQEIARTIIAPRNHSLTWILFVCTTVLVTEEVRMWLQESTSQVNHNELAQCLRQEIEKQSRALLTSLKLHDCSSLCSAQLVPTPLASPRALSDNRTHTEASKQRLEMTQSRKLHEGKDCTGREEELNSTRIREFEVARGLSHEQFKGLNLTAGGKSVFRPSEISLF